MKRLIVFVFLALLAPLLAGGCALNRHIRITEVHDGGSLAVTDPEGVETPIHLYGIHAPGPDQPHGAASKQALEVMAVGENIWIETMGKDDQGRIIAVVVVNGRNLNREMIRAGAARVDRARCAAPFCREWAGWESDARIQRRGLWALPSVPPQGP